MEKHSATHHRDTATESQNNSEQATPEEPRYHRQNAMNHMGSEPSVGTSNYDTTEGNATVQMTPINTNTQQTTCQYQASCEYRTEESGTQHQHNWTKQAFDYYSRCLPTV
ncbi:hypothetical protein I6N95_04025 [Vagococcus sp. BWB3-3]|uniref:Uncharacterized protein n=1 Tax=Vagococcus allomyrinae TaxID=2794353 RepID=A0A940P2C3_9ENTE|nr:hypothetical protein [Vagococcus allomyrinae]MBP1040174.1 hypothetical protein [Vagococcus allomyrinae]